MATTLGDEDEVHSTKSAAFAETLEEVTDEAPITLEQPIYEPPTDAAAPVADMGSPSAALEEAEPASVDDSVVAAEPADYPPPISSNSLGGSFTDNIRTGKCADQRNYGRSSPVSKTTRGEHASERPL